MISGSQTEHPAALFRQCPHQRGAGNVFQTVLPQNDDGASLQSAWRGAAVPDGLPPTSLWHRIASASTFQQPSSYRRTALPAQHV